LKKLVPVRLRCRMEKTSAPPAEKIMRSLERSYRMLSELSKRSSGVAPPKRPKLESRTLPGPVDGRRAWALMVRSAWHRFHPEPSLQRSPPDAKLLDPSTGLLTRLN
jgi:hypothetical protein